MYKYLLFDADGTLYDFSASENYAIEQTWKEFGIDSSEKTVSTYLRCNAEAWARFERGEVDIETLKLQRFENFFRECNISLDPRTVGARFLENVGSVSVMFPQTMRIITELKKRGYKLYLVTNGVHEVQMKRLKRPETDAIYEGVYTPHILGSCKPKKEVFDSLFKMVGIGEDERRKAIIIGDSLNSDILGGINAGLDTVWYNPGKRPQNPQVKPTYEISDLDQLLELFPPLA